MVTIVPRPRSWQEALGTGLAEGLQRLAQNKAQEISQRQQATGLSALKDTSGNPIFNSEEAQALILQDPVIQKEIVKQRLAAPQQAAYAQALGLGQPEGGEGEMMQQAMGQQPRFTEKQATEIAKLNLKRQQMAQKQRSEAFKLTKEDRKELYNQEKAAKDELEDLERIEDLEKTGELDTPGYIEMLKRSGFDLPTLMSPESEEFQKITANFIRNAKPIYGSRITNFDLEQFLKTIPSLSQSPEGRKRVIANLKRIARGKVEYSKAGREIIQENNGIPPEDLLEQISDRIDKRLKKISAKFKEDLAKKVPKGQNRVMTALQTGVGSLVGGAGGLVKSVANPLNLLKTLA